LNGRDRLAPSHPFKTRRSPAVRLAAMNRLSSLLIGSALLLQACVQAAPSPSPAVAAASLRCTGAVSEVAWQAFVGDEIAPRLPAGFTLLAARGQWRGADGAVRAEDSRVLEVVGDDDAALRQSLAEIVGRYKQRFTQESVLVTQSPTRACW
jgi:hypothetical protein